MRPLPRSVRLAAWGTAALRGATSPDEAVSRIIAGDLAHAVRAMPDEERDVGLALAIGRLRAREVRGLRVVLPVPGDASGLPGPAPFNARALAAGEAVLTADGPALGLVPAVDVRGGPGDGTPLVRWDVTPVTPAPPGGPPDAGLSLAEAERTLHEDLVAATEALAAMDVARWRPEAAAALARLRAPVDEEDLLPDIFPARAQRVLVLARRVEAIAALALTDPGAAVSATAADHRAGRLAALARVARHAQVCACNAVLESPPA